MSIRDISFSLIQWQNFNFHSQMSFYSVCTTLMKILNKDISCCFYTKVMRQRKFTLCCHGEAFVKCMAWYCKYSISVCKVWKLLRMKSYLGCGSFANWVVDVIHKASVYLTHFTWRLLCNITHDFWSLISEVHKEMNKALLNWYLHSTGLSLTGKALSKTDLNSFNNHFTTT